MILETQRLLLREMTPEDFEDLYEILGDPVAMTAYQGPFSREEAWEWLWRQQERYRRDGFGLWGVILRETGEFVGQCGLTWQESPQGRLLEIGYLLKPRHWHKGYATEAAVGCKEYAFRVLDQEEVYSIIRDSNLASQRVALRNGMTPQGGFVKRYREVDMPHIIFRAERSRP